MLFRIYINFSYNCLVKLDLLCHGVHWGDLVVHNTSILLGVHSTNLVIHNTTSSLCPECVMQLCSKCHKTNDNCMYKSNIHGTALIIPLSWSSTLKNSAAVSAATLCSLSESLQDFHNLSLIELLSQDLLSFIWDSFSFNWRCEINNASCTEMQHNTCTKTPFCKIYCK